MFDAPLILKIAGTFLIAGAVKGVIGLGLPTVSLALLTIAVDLPRAMALLLVPSFITNLWQAVAGGGRRSNFSPALAIPADGHGDGLVWKRRADAG